MGAVIPVARIIITRPRHRAYVVLCHVIEVVISRFGYCASFRQSPTFRADRARGFITAVVHVSGSTSGGGGVSIVDTFSVVGGFGLVAGANSFIAFRVLVPVDTALAGSGVGGAWWSPARGYVGSGWSDGVGVTKF